jgi:hypothetical protein
MKKSTEPQKSAVVTLRANGCTLTCAATRRPDGTVRTTVTTRDAAKKVDRGMTAQHADMDAARKHIAGLVTAAERLGWARSHGARAAAPDAFTKLPAPPKAA